jgi:hypothetical protein
MIGEFRSQEFRSQESGVQKFRSSGVQTIALNIKL